MADEILVSEAWLATEFHRLCGLAAGVPTNQRRKFLSDKINQLDISTGLKLALENMMDVSGIIVAETIGHKEKLAIGLCAAIFVLLFVVIAFLVPYPTPFQFFVFRVTLALAAAGIGGVLTGFLHVALGNVDKPWLQAGGGLAVFVVVYLLNPAQLAAHPQP